MSSFRAVIPVLGSVVSLGFAAAALWVDYQQRLDQKVGGRVLVRVLSIATKDSRLLPHWLWLVGIAVSTPTVILTAMWQAQLADEEQMDIASELRWRGIMLGTCIFLLPFIRFEVGHVLCDLAHYGITALAMCSSFLYCLSTVELADELFANKSLKVIRCWLVIVIFISGIGLVSVVMIAGSVWNDGVNAVGCLMEIICFVCLGSLIATGTAEVAKLKSSDDSTIIAGVTSIVAVVIISALYAVIARLGHQKRVSVDPALDDHDAGVPHFDQNEKSQENHATLQVTVKIDGKIYDISNFHDHPGGSMFLKSVTGRDATTHFQIHHLRIERAQARLELLPVVGSEVSDNPWDWNAFGFYATIRQRVALALLHTVDENVFPDEYDIALVPKETWLLATASTRAMRATRIFAVAFWVASFTATVMFQLAWLAVVCGFLTAVMGGFGHNALHRRGHSWDCWLFECAGLPHEGWRKNRHMLHHIQANSDTDPDTEQFPVELGPPRKARMCRRILSPIVFHLIIAVQFIVAPLVQMSDGLEHKEWNLFYATVVPSVQLLILLFAGSFSLPAGNGALFQSFGLWCIIRAVAGVWFGLVNSVLHNQERNWSCSVDEDVVVDVADHDREHVSSSDCVQKTAAYPTDEDWGARQLTVVSDIAIPCGLRGVPLCGMIFMFLHEHTLHHLFPTIDHSRLHELRPIVASTAEEFGLKLQDPRNHISLYIGLLATIAGLPMPRRRNK